MFIYSNYIFFRTEITVVIQTVILVVPGVTTPVKTGIIAMWNFASVSNITFTSFNPWSAEMFYINQENIDDLVTSFRFIWIPYVMGLKGDLSFTTSEI